MLLLIPAIYGVIFCVCFAWAKSIHGSPFRLVNRISIAWGLSYGVGYFAFGWVGYQAALLFAPHGRGVHDAFALSVGLGLSGAITAFLLGRSFRSWGVAASVVAATIALIVVMLNRFPSNEWILIAAPALWNSIWFAGVMMFCRRSVPLLGDKQSEVDQTPDVETERA